MKKVFGILLSVLLACTSCGDGASKSEPSFKVYDEYSKEKKVEKKKKELSFRKNLKRGKQFLKSQMILKIQKKILLT